MSEELIVAEKLVDDNLGQTVHHFYNDGCEYKGTVNENNTRDGSGEYVFAKTGSSDDKNTYIGDFKNGYFNGSGQFFYDNGDIYTGSWENCNKKGKGEFLYSNGNKYLGHWSSDKMNGSGELFLANGDHFRGLFVDGLR